MHHEDPDLSASPVGDLKRDSGPPYVGRIEPHRRAQKVDFAPDPVRVREQDQASIGSVVIHMGNPDLSPDQIRSDLRSVRLPRNRCPRW